MQLWNLGNYAPKKLMYFSGRRISTVSIVKVQVKSTRVMVFHTIPIWLLCARTTAVLGDETSTSQTIRCGNEMQSHYWVENETASLTTMLGTRLC